MQVFSCRV